MFFDLTGKTALVTGSTSGIGLAIAKTLHQAGATVIITGRNEEALKSIKEELKERVFTLNFDLGNLPGIEDFAKRAEELTGQIDILVNNAGLTRDTLAMRMKDEEWNEVINVNLTAVFKLTQQVIAGMSKRRYGRVINISSIVGVMGNAGQANYVASKAGLIGLSKTLAMEFARRNVTVNAIAPGFIMSKMTDVLSPEIKEVMMNQIPSQKFGRPEDIAYAALYLASTEAEYITGQTIHVNGGMMRF